MMLAIGIFLAFIIGGDAIVLPGFLSILFGVIGYIKYWRTNEEEKLIPLSTSALIITILVFLGLTSLLLLTFIDPYSQLEKAKVLNNFSN